MRQVRTSEKLEKSDGQSPGRIWFSLTHNLKSRLAPEQDSCVRLQGRVPIAGPREDGLRDPGNEHILTTQFSQFNLSAPLMARLNTNNFVTPTPVQAGCIPPALEGRDVLATAQTGDRKSVV